MPSVRTIAKRAGVSITTVSRVLNNHPQVNEETRKRVLAASIEERYSPSIGRRTATSIALAYTGEPSLSSPFDSALLVGIQDEIQQSEQDLLILDLRRARQPHETMTQMFARKGVCAVILRTDSQSDHVCRQIAEEGFPHVVIGERFDDANVNYVDCDSRAASREAVEHLLGLGHRKIAICTNVVDDADHLDRLGGYRQALSDHGIDFDERLVLRIPANREGGTQLLRRLLTLPFRPTAVFVVDPMPTIGALTEARKLGIAIPEDLSILGFDDAEMRFAVVPELSAVCQDAASLGREAMGVLRNLLSTEPGPTPVRRVLRTWLEVHASTAVPSGHPLPQRAGAR